MTVILLFLSVFPKLTHSAEKLDALLVSATRSESPYAFLPNAISTIDSQVIEDKGGKLDEALRTVPGVSITQNGGPGQTRSILLRGAESRHTLVMVDGIVVNDPLSPSRSFDFGQIPVDQIERIEILRGPQSVLYGSDAIGGVIHIITKKGDASVRGRMEYGSYQTMNAALAAHGFHASFERSDGFSAADRRDGNSEKDGHRNLRLGGRKDFQLGSSMRWGVQGQYSDSRTDTDAFGGPGGDSRNTFASQTQLLFRTDATYAGEENFQLDGAASIQARDREDNTSGPSGFKARLWKTELKASKKLAKHTFTGGAEYQQEQGHGTGIQQRQKAGTFSLYAQDHFGGPAFGTFGGRFDRHDRHGNAGTGRAGLGLWIDPEVMRVKASIGTGYKAPSLYQLYSTFGDIALRPERSLGWDASFEWRESNWAFEVGWYYNRFRDLIDFSTAASRYQNIGLAETQGVEAGFQVEEDAWLWKNSYTSIRSRDRQTGLRLLRRPAHSVSSELARQVESLRLAFAMQWVGPRDDIDPVSFLRKRMPSHVVFGLSGWWKASAKVRLTGRLENAFNRHYQETAGYGTPGRSAYVGLEAQL